MGFWAALAGAVTNTAANAYGAQQQAKATEEAARLAYQTGGQAANIVQQGGLEAAMLAQQGQAGARDSYQQALQYAQAQRSGLSPAFAGYRNAGNNAMARYQAAMLGGNQSAVFQDPAFALRMGAAGNAASQLAASAGLGPSVGSGIAAYNQGLASQEYQAALDRLGALGALGTSATGTYANLDANAYGNIQNVYSGMARDAAAAGQFNALLRQNAALAYSNARNSQATNTANYTIQGGNALAHGYGIANQALSRGLEDYLTYQASKG